MDHNHMCIRRADVVLNYQAVSSPGCCRAEARMVEFQRRGTIDAGHERAYQRIVARAEIVSGRALDLLLREADLQCIELLVQIHDQPMQAVAALPVNLRYSFDRAAIDKISLGLRQIFKQDFKTLLGPKVGRRAMIRASLAIEVRSWLQPGR